MTSLQIRRSSSTSVLFTIVGTKSWQWAESYLAQVLAFLARLITACLAIQLLVYQTLAGQPDPRPSTVLSPTRLTILIPSILEDSPQSRTLQTCLAVALLICSMLRWRTEESLLVMHGLGVQTSTTTWTILQGPRTNFVPICDLQDIVIHEAFKKFSVEFYLAVIVKGREEALVVFEKSLPPRHLLEHVWRGARKCLSGIPHSSETQSD